MNGSPVPSSKKTWEGHTRRRELLRRHNIELPDDLGEPGRRAAMDDVLDAAAAAWVALHHENGNTISLPNPPEPMSLQGTAAMWICARLG